MSRVCLRKSYSVTSIRVLFSRPSFQFWFLQICGWTGYFALNYTTMLADGKPLHYVYYSACIALIGLLVTSALRLGYRRLWNLSAPKMALSAVGLLLLALIVDTKLYTEVLFRFCDDCRPSSLIGYIWYFVSHLYVMLSWSGLYFGIKFARQLQVQKEASLKAQAMAHEAQLKMLRYQLNPHFLFNTLNAISTLVLDKRNETANGMIGSLSAFLRYSLDSDPVQRVSLAQEIDAAQLYLGIEQLRFAERLKVSIDIEDDACEALVPSLILQPLIENAIKHAVAKRESGGSLQVEARHRGSHLIIVLRDDGPGGNEMAEMKTSRGVGLANTRERLRVLYGDDQEFRTCNRLPHGFEVHVKLPYERAPASETANVSL
jgi:two-component system, LytTR family, sensor kinase